MSKKANILIITYLAAAAVAFGAYSAVLSTNGGNYRNTAIYSYEHAFDEVVRAADSLDDALRRGSYATGAEMSAAVCADIYGSCLAAEMTMAALPFSTAELEQTAGFMGIAGDYAASLIRSCAGEGFSDAERENLAALADISEALTEALSALGDDIRAGEVVMDDPENVFADTSEQTLMSKVLLDFEGSFPDLPEIEYDGKYSVKNAAAYGSTVSEEDAKKAAAELFGFDESELTAEYSSESGSRCFSFDGGTVIVDGGGKVLSMSSERAVVGSMDDGELLAAAEAFIDDAGFDNMALRSQERVNDVMYTEFVCTCEDVYCLREVIRLGIAADNGSVYSYDARQYVKNHADREIEKPAVSEEAARSAIPESLNVSDMRLACVETEGGNDKLCYEFDCSDADGRAVRVSVDAATGRQYRIEIQ